MFAYAFFGICVAIAAFFLTARTGAAGVDAIGVVLAAMGMAILNYGLSCIGLGSGGWQQIIVGCFMLAFYSLTAQWPRWKEMYRRRARVKEELQA